MRSKWVTFVREGGGCSWCSSDFSGGELGLARVCCERIDEDELFIVTKTFDRECGRDVKVSV